MKEIFGILVTAFTAVVLIALAPFVFIFSFILDVLESKK